MTAPTGVGPGGKREGAGRPFGSINHKARKLIVEAELTGQIMPLDLLLAVVRDPEAPRRERLQAAAIAAPYCHPKLTAHVVSYLDPAKLSDEELLRSIADLERQIAAAEPSQAPPDNPAPDAVIRPALEVPAVLHRPAPAPSDQRRLRYDPITKKMISVLQ
jgi:hypothetical protein